MKLTIDRTQWARGLPQAKSFLLGPQGMCCLGFYAKAIGYSDEAIKDKQTPAHLHDSGLLMPQLVTQSRDDNTDVCNSLMHVNDASSAKSQSGHIEPTKSWTDDQREAKITELFKTIDVEVTFIN